MIRIAVLWIVVVGTATLMGCSSGPPSTVQATPDTLSTVHWKTFKADSGYEISYPLELYSLRNGLSSPDVLFPGTKVLEPNDSFYYNEPRAVTYKVSIAVRVNTENLSLAEPELLLAHSAIIAYDPGVLTGLSIQQITLDGVRALRVDDLPVGPAGITTQIVAVHNDLIYELVVEPQQLTGNQAEAFQRGEVVDSNREWIDRIIATFKFSGQ
jgi:hypothetical protein